ncbi:AMP-dependent synthetase [Sphingobacterium mizutaii NBRC 14946 = DSM 11724]|uniref:Long-chain-fatty-acid--CoA ligase FadD15 n=2 Tax=Sphingobacterium mizutaii TaxID=1010 RepID=A0AAJ4XCT9_9SPHI|nr:AMP-dependent synthetase/ligase [Sphingobacterium mizutaii]GEM70099.1 AMP-dependent synthetase [Sphingobacterium mizutaii NBRC 14946 = DSM 11724]SDL24665.1 long-chain acyl-CoA synthetase [Sphingobacterium mizutaii]SNV53067.1 Long-chain-fatty-acid--CoA ligase FadD15 [Sphingobacterium mizutaii]
MIENLRLFDLALRQVNLFPDLNMFAHKKEGEWKTLTSVEFLEQVNAISKGLIELGVKPNDKVGLIADSSIEWHIVDFAIQQIGAVVVAIYPNISDTDYQFIFNDAEIKLCIVSNKSLYHRLTQLNDSIYTLKYIFCIEKNENVRNWDELRTVGAHIPDSKIEELRANIQHTDLATLIYTSGTTGKPKGVMLTHHNIISNVEAAREITPCKAYDRALTFLPPCHAYERMVIYTYMYIGITIHIAESLDKIGQNINEVKPHIMTAVPRILEKVYEKIMKTGMELTGMKRKIFDWAVEVAEQFDPNPEKRSFGYNFKLKLAKKLVLDKWYQALGGHLQTVASGSASLQAKLARVFLAAGIPLYEGYGMTEASPLISVNHYLKGIRIGTVGLAVKYVEIKLADDGEILVKGPNVMQGYYKNKEETDKTIIDGWLHTGDIGVWEDEEFLKIIDRKKEMFKISGGKYVVPQPIEKKLLESNYIEQAMVIGDGQKFASAFIVPNYAHLQDWSKNEAPELKGMPKDQFLTESKVLRKINKEVQLANQHFGNWEQIKKPIILSDEFTIENGELTPTLKMKRKVILEKYKKEFEELYHLAD